MIKITIEKAVGLPTKRLLAYFKKHGRSYQAKYLCDCCGEFLWDVRDGYKERKKEYKIEKSYWLAIKAVLDERENIVK